MVWWRQNQLYRTDIFSRSSGFAIFTTGDASCFRAKIWEFQTQTNLQEAYFFSETACPSSFFNSGHKCSFTNTRPACAKPRFPLVTGALRAFSNRASRLPWCTNWTMMFLSAGLFGNVVRYPSGDVHICRRYFLANRFSHISKYAEDVVICLRLHCLNIDILVLEYCSHWSSRESFILICLVSFSHFFSNFSFDFLRSWLFVNVCPSWPFTSLYMSFIKFKLRFISRRSFRGSFEIIAEFLGLCLYDLPHFLTHN